MKFWNKKTEDPDEPVEQTSSTKFCKDCKFFRPSPPGMTVYVQPHCRAVTRTYQHFSRIYGPSSDTLELTCDEARDDVSTCGPAAKLWEAIEPAPAASSDPQSPSTAAT